MAAGSNYFGCKVCCIRGVPFTNATLNSHLQTKGHKFMKMLFENDMWPETINRAVVNKNKLNAYRFMDSHGSAILCIHCNKVTPGPMSLFEHQLEESHRNVISHKSVNFPVIYFCETCETMVCGLQNYYNHCFSAEHSAILDIKNNAELVEQKPGAVDINEVSALDQSKSDSQTGLPIEVIGRRPKTPKNVHRSSTFSHRILVDKKPAATLSQVGSTTSKKFNVEQFGEKSQLQHSEISVNSPNESAGLLGRNDEGSYEGVLKALIAHLSKNDISSTSHRKFQGNDSVEEVHTKNTANHSSVASKAANQQVDQLEVQRQKPKAQDTQMRLDDAAEKLLDFLRNEEKIPNEKKESLQNTKSVESAYSRGTKLRPEIDFVVREEKFLKKTGDIPKGSKTQLMVATLKNTLNLSDDEISMLTSMQNQGVEKSLVSKPVAVAADVAQVKPRDADGTPFPLTAVERLAAKLGVDLPPLRRRGDSPLPDSNDVERLISQLNFYINEETACIKGRLLALRQVERARDALVQRQMDSQRDALIESPQSPKKSRTTLGGGANASPTSDAVPSDPPSDTGGVSAAETHTLKSFLRKFIQQSPNILGNVDADLHNKANGNSDSSDAGYAHDDAKGAAPLKSNTRVDDTPLRSLIEKLTSQRRPDEAFILTPNFTTRSSPSLGRICDVTPMQPDGGGLLALLHKVQNELTASTSNLSPTIDVGVQPSSWVTPAGATKSETVKRGVSRQKGANPKRSKH